MPDPKNTPARDNQRLVNMTVVALVGQVGCLTLLIVLGAVFAGMWIDSRMNSKPIGTILLVAVSVPVAIFVMLKVVRSTLKKLGLDTAPQPNPNEGKSQDSEDNG